MEKRDFPFVGVDIYRVKKFSSPTLCTTINPIAHNFVAHVPLFKIIVNE